MSRRPKRRTLRAGVSAGKASPAGAVVGRELRFLDGSPWLTIVGVIGDVHQQRLDRAPIPEVYVPLEQDAWPSSMFLVARTSEPLARLAPALRAAVWSVDDEVPVSEIRPMREVVRQSILCGPAFARTGLAMIDNEYLVVDSAFASLLVAAGAALALGAIGHWASWERRSTVEIDSGSFDPP